MDRRTENRLLGALGAVVVAGMIVMVVAVAMALAPSDSGTAATLAAASPTQYNEEAAKQAIVDRIEATQAAAKAEAFLHPELLPPRHPGLLPTPTSTPVPVPVGVPCTSDQLTAAQIGENAATGGQLFVSVGIANLTATPCDLPVIRGIDALDKEGVVVASLGVPVGRCGLGAVPFCVADVTLPMQPVDHAPGFHASAAGMVAILIGYSSGCWGKPYGYVCKPNESRNLMMHFGGGIDIPVTFALSVLWPDGYYPSVWSLGLVGPTTN